MPLVNAKCTNCGATLSVDNTKDALICQFCGSAFVVEKAINNYNITNNIKANTVNIYGKVDNDFVIRAGVLEKYNGTSSKVVIPDNVSYIGAAFEWCYGLEEVTIPNTVKVIGGHAFKGCRNLKTINIPSSVIEIGARAFDNCINLKNIVIPNSVKKIGLRAFNECESIVNIKIPEYITQIETSTFRGCRSLVSVYLPSGLKRIENGAFNGCTNLASVKLPIGVKIDCKSDPSEDEGGAFFGCFKLEDVDYYGIIDGKTLWSFEGTPWIENIKKTWRKQGLCDRCGSPIKGIFTRECTKCRKKF